CGPSRSPGASGHVPLVDVPGGRAGGYGRHGAGDALADDVGDRGNVQADDAGVVGEDAPGLTPPVLLVGGTHRALDLVHGAVGGRIRVAAMVDARPAVLSGGDVAGLEVAEDGRQVHRAPHVQEPGIEDAEGGVAPQRLVLGQLDARLLV